MKYTSFFLMKKLINFVKSYVILKRGDVTRNFLKKKKFRFLFFYVHFFRDYSSMHELGSIRNKRESLKDAGGGVLEPGISNLKVVQSCPLMSMENKQNYIKLQFRT